MPDPVTSAFLANLASDLTLDVLKMLNRKLRDAIEGTPRQQALKRCYQSATVALLPEDDPVSEQYRPVLRELFAQPVVQAEMAKLAKGREPDIETLVEMFEDAKYDLDQLPTYDFPTHLVAAIEVFLDTIEEEPELAEVIQTAQLRDIATSLRRIAPAVQAIRQRVEQYEEPTIRIPPSASPALRQAIRALDSAYSIKREEGINSIAQSKDPIAFDVLLSAMVNHPTNQIRGIALDKLRQYGRDTRAIPALIEMLAEDDWGFHTDASLMLEGYGEEAMPKLLNALSHQNPKVRYGSAVTLGKIGNPEATPKLVEALSDENGNVRCGAADALGKIKESTAVSALAELLSDTEKPEWTGQRVCDAADMALQNIGTPEAFAARSNYTG